MPSRSGIGRSSLGWLGGGGRLGGQAQLARHHQDVIQARGGRRADELVQRRPGTSGRALPAGRGPVAVVAS
ncbi:MAG TPA: hypothetical protein VHU92_00825 [Streptosporangiaceae bacterium]|nr:hypothetical protein [Streptosporangiaceae bacterium]